jgi:hypothetical protein
MPSSKIIPFPSMARPRLVPDDGIQSTVSSWVTFISTFELPGMDGPHAPGTFEVRETREALNVMWAASHITKRIMLRGHGIVEALEVSSADLDAALERDRPRPT